MWLVMMIFRKLMALEEAQKVIAKHVKLEPLGVEQVPLLETNGRILAEDVCASLNIPPFNRSTVDGYAVKAEDTFGAEENRPVVLKISGTVNIGEQPETVVRRCEAAEIATGAPIPAGANAVVMVEHTERDNEALSIFRAVAADENVMKAGADIKKGEKIVKAGQELHSRQIGVLAALGISEVKVHMIPRIAVFSTGPEINEPGKELVPGRIYDINSYSLSAAVLESGGRPLYLGVSADNPAELYRAVKQALASADMVVTSGGVSVGPKDVMPKVLDSVGRPGLIVCGIAIKPGKPTTVALTDGKPVFALPGHPTSALLVFHLLVRPVIRALSGRKPEEDFEIDALASIRMFPAKGRRTFVAVRLKHDMSNRLLAEPIPSAGSGAITTLAKADGFVEIPEDVQFIDKEEIVHVRLFSNKHGKGMP
jgi:putative molybdopterin biosynthesis protein